jgi:hypothetical protein
MRILLLPLLAAALLLLANGCREKKEADCFDPFNPACADYDPCLQKFRTEAEFGLFSYSTSSFSAGGHYLPYRDTIPVPHFGDARVYFHAEDERMSGYEWQVGFDPRIFTASRFSLLFSNNSGWIDVSLTTFHDKADSSCFPGDSGEATVTKSYYLQPYENEVDGKPGWLALYPIFGSYLGHVEATPQDTFQIEITYDIIRPSLNAILEGFPFGCSRLPGVHFSTHYLYAELEQGSPCQRPHLFAALQEDGRGLIIDYSIEGPSGQRIQRRWVGVKVP